MTLSFLYWAFCRVLQLIRLIGRSDTDLAVEVVMLRHEVAVLRRQVHRPALEPADRAGLAGLARLLPHRRLGRFFVPPETLLRWQRDLVAKRWTYSHGRPGRSGKHRQVPHPRPRHQVHRLLRRRLAAEGTRIIKSPVLAPRANAICEHVIGTLRRECLDRMLILGRRHLETVLAEYVEHYNSHRPHRSLSQRPPADSDATPSTIRDVDAAKLRRTDRLGGLLHEYRMVA